MTEHLPAGLLPPQLHVFVRDWLSSNNVLLKSRDGHVLIDSGYVRHAPLTLALLASERGIGTGATCPSSSTRIATPTTSAAMRRSSSATAAPWRCRQPRRRWSSAGTARRSCTTTATSRWSASPSITCCPPATTHVWGDLEWQALAAPGHDMGALVFYNPEYRILISGDALWENGFGFVMPPEIDPAALPATRATIEMLARLDIRVVIPGHGEPFTDVAAAIARARKRIDAFEADSLRIARHALKVNLMFVAARQAAHVAGRHAGLRRARGNLPRLQRALLPVAAGEARRAARRRAGEAGAASREDGWLVPGLNPALARSRSAATWRLSRVPVAGPTPGTPRPGVLQCHFVRRIRQSRAPFVIAPFGAARSSRSHRRQHIGRSLNGFSPHAKLVTLRLAGRVTPSIVRFAVARRITRSPSKFTLRRPEGQRRVLVDR